MVEPAQHTWLSGVIVRGTDEATAVLETAERMGSVETLVYGRFSRIHGGRFTSVVLVPSHRPTVAVLGQLVISRERGNMHET